MNRLTSISILNNDGYTVSLVVNRNKKYGIVFNGNSILNFIIIPDDYIVKEFMNIVTTNYNIKQYIFDKNGHGIEIEDFLELKCSIFARMITGYPYNYIIKALPIAKESIISYAINSQFDLIGKKEYLKLIDELNNIEIGITDNGTAKLKLINPEKDVTRAMCYLQYFFTK